MPTIYRVNSVSSVELMQYDHATASDFEAEAQDSDDDGDGSATPVARSCIAPPPSLDTWAARLESGNEIDFQMESPLDEIVLPLDQRAAFERDENGTRISQVESFYEWLERMEETSDHEQIETRAALAESLKDLVASLQTAGSGLRERCFAIATDALASCDDRVADALNDMHAVVFDATAELAGKTDDELRDIARSYFALHLVDVQTAHYLAALDARHESHEDEVEVRLAFRLFLKTQFNLPIQVNGMLYQAHANISADGRRAASRAVQGGLDDKKRFAAFLAEWPPLRRCIEQRSTDEVHALTEDYLAEGGRLEDAAESGLYTSRQYQEAYNALRAKRLAAEKRVIDEGLQNIIGRLVGDAGRVQAHQLP